MRVGAIVQVARVPEVLYEEAGARVDEEPREEEARQEVDERLPREGVGSSQEESEGARREAGGTRLPGGKEGRKVVEGKRRPVEGHGRSMEAHGRPAEGRWKVGGRSVQGRCKVGGSSWKLACPEKKSAPQKTAVTMEANDESVR